MSRTSTAVAGVAAAAILLTGCGTDDPETGTSADPTPAAADTAAPAGDATDAPTDASAPEDTAAPTEGSAEQPADGVVVSNDGSFEATLPQGWVDGRELVDALEADTVGELGMDMPEGELKSMVENMQIDQIPWIAFDGEGGAAGFASNLNIIGTPTGGAGLDAMLESLPDPGSFGETATNEHELTTVAGKDVIQYDYTLPTPQLEAQGRQVYVVEGDQLLIVTYTTAPEAFDDAVVEGLVESITVN